MGRKRSNSVTITNSQTKQRVVDSSIPKKVIDRAEIYLYGPNGNSTRIINRRKGCKAKITSEKNSAGFWKYGSNTDPPFWNNSENYNKDNPIAYSTNNFNGYWTCGIIYFPADGSCIALQIYREDREVGNPKWTEAQKENVGGGIILYASDGSVICNATFRGFGNDSHIDLIPDYNSSYGVKAKYVNGWDPDNNKGYGIEKRTTGDYSVACIVPQDITTYKYEWK